jgi:hypothetical protein
MIIMSKITTKIELIKYAEGRAVLLFLIGITTWAVMCIAGLYARIILARNFMIPMAIATLLLILCIIYLLRRYRILQETIKRDIIVTGRIEIIVTRRSKIADITQYERMKIRRDEVFWLEILFDYKGKEYRARHYIARIACNKVLTRINMNKIAVAINMKEIHRSYCRELLIVTVPWI